MIDVTDEIKELYKQSGVNKTISLYFPELNLTVNNDKIVSESFALTESICSDTDLTLGACEAAEVELTIFNVIQELSGKTFIITQTIGEHIMPLGTYIVDSCKMKHNQKIKQITAYDTMLRTDIDVAFWYNSLTFPITVKAMRESLLSFLDIDYEVQALTNDTVMLEKTILPSSLIGRDVLTRLCELNAGFGHITRQNKFKVIQLSGLGLYPSETLYPSEELFPSESGEYITSGFYKIDYEEYIVEQITSLTIRQDDEDNGTTVGDIGNPYIITGNFLIYGKDSAEMQDIAEDIFTQIKNKYYRPHTTTMIGLSYLEVGDSVVCITNNDAVESFIFSRKLTGIKALKDEISATGNKFRSETASLKVDTQQLKGKSLVIKKTIDELSSTLTDVENNLSSEISQTATEIRQEVNDTANGLQGQITTQAGQIGLKVSSNGVIAAINLSPESATIQANNISLEGLVTINNRFQVLMDGSIKAVNGEFEGKITSNSADITGGSFKVTASGQNDARIQLTYSTFISSLSPYSLILNSSSSSNFYTAVRPGEVFVGNVTGTNNTTIGYSGIDTPSCTVDGSSVITSSTKGSYTYPPEFHTHTTSTHINASSNTSGQIPFLNGINGAGWSWVNNNFQPLSPSDERLKINPGLLSDLPIELFMAIKARTYEFREGCGGKGINFGFYAQDVEKAFEAFGLDPFKYNIVQIIEPRESTNEGLYILDGKMHIINYQNFHAWELDILQRICEKINLT